MVGCVRALFVLADPPAPDQRNPRHVQRRRRAARGRSLSPARAEASRRNGARSRGPKTPEGKARSAQNALKHGLRAQKCVVLPGEDAAAFAALEAALLEDLAPEGALQSVLAQRVVAASWRLARAERLEAELFAATMLAGRSLGLALIRDCNGARSFDTLLRYRGGDARRAVARAAHPQGAPGRAGGSAAEPAGSTPRSFPSLAKNHSNPSSRTNPGDSAPARAASEPRRPRPRACLRRCRATRRERARSCPTDPAQRRS